jgi:hypothetical protein
MGVHFAYRDIDAGPAGRHVAHFPKDRSVVEWFRKRWRAVPEPNCPDDPVRGLLGCGVWGLDNLFEAIAEEGLAPPRDMGRLRDEIEERCHVHDIASDAHALQVLTDDDNGEMAWYFLDDEYLASAKGWQAAYLLHDGWRLPGGAGPGGFVWEGETRELGRGRGEGRSWAVILDADGHDWLSDIRPVYAAEGARLPGLAGWMWACGADAVKGWPWELRLLRTQCEPAGPLGEALARTNALNVQAAAMADRSASRLFGTAEAARRELEKMLPQGAQRHRDNIYQGDPARSLLHDDGHLAQLVLHCVGANEYRPSDTYCQWVFFDDVWASAQPEVARGLLHYASRWDVLS